MPKMKNFWRKNLSRTIYKYTENAKTFRWIKKFLRLSAQLTDYSPFSCGTITILSTKCWSWGGAASIPDYDYLGCIQTNCYWLCHIGRPIWPFSIYNWKRSKSRKWQLISIENKRISSPKMYSPINLKGNSIYSKIDSFDPTSPLCHTWSSYILISLCVFLSSFI